MPYKGKKSVIVLGGSKDTGAEQNYKQDFFNGFRIQFNTFQRLYYISFRSSCKLFLCKYFVKQYCNKDNYPYYNKNAYHSHR